MSHNVKFKENCFSAKEMKLTHPALVSLNNHQIPESDNEPDSSGLDLVNLAQPPTRPHSPGLSASGQPVIPSQSAQPQSPPFSPPQAPRSSNTPLPDMDTALHLPTAPRYSFCPTKE